jgi:hypothetical protein
MSTDDILGALQSVLALLSKIRPDFLPTLKDLLEKLSGDSGPMWWEQLKRFVCKKPCWLPTILRIDRSVKFDPAKFLGEGWSIWKGPPNGDGLEGEEEQDACALALAEIDLAQVRLEHMLEGEETWIQGEDKLERLKKASPRRIRLDARVFQTLWEDQSKIPESWKELTNGNTTFIYFDGTVLRDSSSGRYVLYLCWDVGQWHWRAHWLENVWRRHDPSAVLAENGKKRVAA